MKALVDAASCHITRVSEKDDVMKTVGAAVSARSQGIYRRGRIRELVLGLSARTPHCRSGRMPLLRGGPIDPGAERLAGQARQQIVGADLGHAIAARHRAAGN